MRYAAIMLSRQPLRPTRQTPWVAKSAEAVRWLKANGLGLISSIGLQTWELLTTLASDQAVPMRILLPCSSSEEFLAECDRVVSDFDLARSPVEFALVRNGVGRNPSHLSLERDRRVVETAFLLIPVSCRPRGNMSSLLGEARERGREIEDRFVIENSPATESISYSVGDQPLNPDLQAAASKYLIHWTRATSTAWPGELRAEFYRDILESEVWPRSALATLRRIVRMKSLLASGRHMPGNVPTVSFSALSPLDAVPLMRWRARYREMSFEPYGIGLERSLAESLGLHDVKYFDSGDEVTGLEEDRWKWQSSGRITKWRAEREYRCKGDLDLHSVPAKSMALFCRTAEEAQQLAQVHDGPIWPFWP